MALGWVSVDGDGSEVWDTEEHREQVQKADGWCPVEDTEDDEREDRKFEAYAARIDQRASGA